MSERIKDLVNNIVAGKNSEAEDAIKSELDDRISSRMDDLKDTVASGIFDDEEESELEEEE